MPKLFVTLAAAGLFACGSNSNNNTTDGGGSGSGSGSNQGSGSGSGSGSGIGSGVGSGADLSCAGDAAPAPNANVTLSGTIDVVALNGTSIALTPYSGDVDIYNGSDKLASTTATSGSFTSSPLPTGGTAIPVYLEISGSGNETTLAYPAAPAGTDTTFQAVVFPTSLLSLLSLGLGSACPQGSADGLFGVLVEDCNGARITDTANVMVSLSAGGGSAIDISTLAGSDLAGFFLVCNVPPGDETITVKYKTTTFLTNRVTSVAGETTEAIVRPGY